MTKNSDNNIAPLLKKVYFWDVDFGPGKPFSKRTVIERVFTFGTLDELALLIRYFGKDEVEGTLLKLNYLDKKTLNFASKFFGKSIKRFKCYIRKQLIPQTWNY
jgi:hypothetical protein